MTFDELKPMEFYVDKDGRELMFDVFYNNEIAEFVEIFIKEDGSYDVIDWNVRLTKREVKQLKEMY
jgi:hypothetical protein